MGEVKKRSSEASKEERSEELWYDILYDERRKGGEKGAGHFRVIVAKRNWEF